jgi:hypothetical protein
VARNRPVIIRRRYQEWGGGVTIDGIFS